MFVTGLIPSSFTAVPILPSVSSLPSGLRATAFLPDVTQWSFHWIPGQYGVRHPINIAYLLTKTDSNNPSTSILLVLQVSCTRQAFFSSLRCSVKLDTSRLICFVRNAFAEKLDFSCIVQCANSRLLLCSYFTRFEKSVT